MVALAWILGIPMGEANASPLHASVPAGQAVGAGSGGTPTVLHGEGGAVLPATAYTRPDGSTETVADRGAVKALVAKAAAANTPCGSACDGKDPQSFVVPGTNYRCSSDAYTVYSSSGYATAELRYSPRCQTAWTRGCCYTMFAGFGYYANGSYRNVVYANGKASGSTIWTAMLDDARLLFKACWDNQMGGAPDWKCTPTW